MKNHSETAYHRAQKKVERIKVFYRHLITYLVINTLGLCFWLFVIRSFYKNIENQDIKIWLDANFIFFSGVWTIILIFHGLHIFKGHKFKKIEFTFFKKWEERKIKQFMEAEENLKE